MDGDGEGLVRHSGPDLGRARDRQRAPNQKYPEYLNEELEEILEARRLCVCGLCTYPPVFCQDI